MYETGDVAKLAQGCDRWFTAGTFIAVAMRRHEVAVPRDSLNESVKDFDRRFEDVADAALGDNELRL